MLRRALAIASALAAAAAVLLPALPASAALPPETPAPHRIRGDVCPHWAPAGTLQDGSATLGVQTLCERAVARAATPQAKAAIRAGLFMLGAPYACGDVGRADPWRFDCSSLVSRAYQIGAGIPGAGPGWSASTRDLLPWDGRPLAAWLKYVPVSQLRPGDLVVYDTGASLSRHVVMYLGDGYQLHTNFCGGVARVTRFYGTNPNGTHHFAVVRRVVMGAPAPADLTRTLAGQATRVSYADLLRHDRAATIRVQVALNKAARIGILVDGKWNGGMQAAFVGFRRIVLGWPMSASLGPPDRATLRALGARAGFTLVA